MFSYLRRPAGFYRRVGALAAPMILQNLITSTLAMADTFMVGMLGEAPMAAVTLANIPMFVVQLFFFGVQSGATVLISQYWGRGNLQAINRVTGVALWAVNLVSVTFALILLLFPQEFLSLFGNDPQVVAMAADYGRIVGLSYVLNGMTLVYIAVWRSMERPRLGMYILAASMTVNTCLNWVLIFGNLGAPALGVRGAAIATLTARVVEILIVVVHMMRTRSFRFSPGKLLCPGREMTGQFLRCAGPVVCNETLWGLGTAIFPTIMGHMAGSTEILAAYTIAGNVEKLCLVFAIGISGTASILIGREIGAGRGDSVYELGLVLNTLSVGVGTLLCISLLSFTYLAGPAWFFPLFHLSPGACSIATMMLTVLAVMIPVRDFNHCNIVGVLRGGGDVKAATLIDLSPLWVVSIPLATLAGSVLHMDILWVYLAMSCEHVVKCGLGILRLRSGKWVHDLTRMEPFPE